MKCNNCFEESKDLIKFKNEYYCKECYDIHIAECVYCKKYLYTNCKYYKDIWTLENKPIDDTQCAYGLFCKKEV